MDLVQVNEHVSLVYNYASYIYVVNLLDLASACFLLTPMLVFSLIFPLSHELNCIIYSVLSLEERTFGCTRRRTINLGKYRMSSVPALKLSSV